jgi:hypothetical protein
LLTTVAPAWAQTPTLRIPRVTTPPSLDAVIGGGTPSGVEVSGFRQREPGDGDPASQDTRAYLSYDDDHFYVVFVCKDEPGKTRAHLARREAITEDDIVALVLDTYQDGRRAYLFIANALGIQRDGVITEGQDDDYTYDALWRSDGRLTPDGYVVLLAIPFKSLRFSNATQQTWAVAVARIVTRANETSFWPYVTRRISSVGQQLATLEGIEGVSPGRNLQAIPYADYAWARELGEDGVRAADNAWRAGVDAKAVIKDAVTVDLTVNPDFSQVESDEPQVTVNQRFEVFFPEKRPFFIENAGYFQTPQDLFFSRRIADPNLGVRVTGRSRGWSFGGLVTDDEQPGRAVEPDDPRFDERAGVVVARVQREFARQSSLGAIFTDREFGDTFNRVWGVDGRWRLDDNWTVTGQWIGSDTKDVDGAGSTGTSTFLAVSRESRAFDYEGTFLSRSPDFRADLGFIPRVDFRRTEHEAGYAWFPKGRKVLRIATDLEAGALWDYDGQLQEWTIEPGAEVELPGQTEIGVRHWQEMERFGGADFRLHTSAAYAATSWISWLGGSVFYRWGTGINYYPAEGIAPFLAGTQEVEANVTLRPTSQLRLEQIYLFSRLSTRDGHVPAGVSAGTIFDNHIARSRLNYQFTRELSARVIVDYEAVLPDTSLVSLEPERRLNFDLLATYQVNPWTAVYAGYADAYENLLVSPLTRPPIVRGGSASTSVGRQVFVKVSYLLRY